MGLINILDAVLEDIKKAQDIDDLTQPLDDLSAYIDQRQTSKGLEGIGATYNLAAEDHNRIKTILKTAITQSITHKRNSTPEAYFTNYENNDLLDTVYTEAQKIGILGDLVDALGHEDSFLEEIKSAGAQALPFFDSIQDRITTPTPLKFPENSDGMEKIMDAYVEGLKEWTDCGYVQHPDCLTYGISAFGDHMKQSTINKLAEIGFEHSQAIKHRTMAAIIEHPESSPLSVNTPKDHPEAEKYREWLKDIDIESYLDEIHKESIHAGADFLKHAKPEHKDEMIKNYVLALGFIENCEQGHIFKIKPVESRALQRFIAQLPEGYKDMWKKEKIAPLKATNENE